jgi:hypothetical protein
MWRRVADAKTKEFVSTKNEIYMFTVVATFPQHRWHSYLAMS